MNRGIRRGGTLAAAALAVVAGCRDELVAPTMGFLQVETGGIIEVDVWVDDELVGQGPGRLGPFEAGDYRVRAEKKYYDVLQGELTARVRPAEAARVSFDLNLVVSGAAQVAAVDEFDGTEVTGAEIWTDDGSGLVNTGKRAPTVLGGLPPGPLDVVLRKPGFEDSTPLTVQVAEFDTVAAVVELGPLRAVLAEMTTFQTCPNCPAAVDSLDAIRADHPERLYVVEWHTEFFSLFTLYDPRWEARKVTYYQIGNFGDPSLIVQGDVANLINVDTVPPGSLSDYRPAVETALAACGADCAVALRTEGTVDASGIDVTVRLKWRGGTLPAGLMLRVVALEDSVVAFGNEPFGFSDVPRDLHEQAVSLTLGGIVTVPVSFPVDPSWNPEKLHWVAFLQSDETREILAVHGRH